MGLQAKPAEKLADAVGAHTALEAENIEGRHHQAQKPPRPFCSFPQPRLWGAISAFYRLFEPMYAALGKPGALGNLTNALRRIVTKSVENPKAFGPKSHVGWSSDR
jgi:hypothetical protein